MGMVCVDMRDARPLVKGKKEIRGVDADNDGQADHKDRECVA
jgi:hypothetical protein